MVLKNLVMADTGRLIKIRIANGKIAQVSAAAVSDIIPEDNQLYFRDAIVFPGLINSHDHLDFNLFPQLGNLIYKNYSEWGKHIHEAYADEIAAVLKIPQALRSEWGMYKNLLCGVTTVVNHGTGGNISNKLITIHNKKHDLHSVGFDKQWKWRLNNPLKKNLPVVIHTGEGTDAAAQNEIDELITNNYLKRQLIGIHGVAMQPHQAKYFKALVWCPQSNYFLLHKTAAIDKLANHTKILFGTDSTLTSFWSIWDHIQFAHETALLSDEELYKTLNQNPATTWNLTTGQLADGKDADLVVARMKNPQSASKSFFALRPVDVLLVMHQGNIRLIDETMVEQLTINLTNYIKIYIDGACKYIQGDLSALIKKIKTYYPAADFPISLQP